PDTEFPIQNLPYCHYLSPDDQARAGVRIGDEILDLNAAFGIPSLDTVLGMGKGDRVDLRRRISSFLSTPQSRAQGLLTAVRDARLLLPCQIGDYTDFYASRHHAMNVGALFRPDKPLMSNYEWMPIAYHGRASSIVPSGTLIRRPWGQVAANREGPPEYGP